MKIRRNPAFSDFSLGGLDFHRPHRQPSGALGVRCSVAKTPNHRRNLMKSYFWLPFIALLGIGSIAQAQPPFRPGPGAYAPTKPAHPQTEAAAELRAGLDKLTDFLNRKEKPNKLQVAAFLDETIAPYFDFDYMAKWVAGRNFSALSARQREALAASIEARFLGALAGKLAKYQGQKVRFFRPRRGPRGAISIPVGVLRPGGYPSKLEFRMYRAQDGWKVYDVIANGRSAVAYYRQEMRQSRSSGRPGPYGG
jgi:phospholipid transport system substrate-binding protein